MEVNYIIYSLGMKGQVIDKAFVPYREKDGTFPIFSEKLQLKNKSDKIQKAENKVPNIRTVKDAVSLLKVEAQRIRDRTSEHLQTRTYSDSRAMRPNKPINPLSRFAGRVIGGLCHFAQNFCPRNTTRY